jgi:hypothetical protein
MPIGRDRVDMTKEELATSMRHKSAWEAVSGPAREAARMMLGELKKAKQTEAGAMSATEALAQLLMAYRDYPMPPDQEAYVVAYNYVVDLEQNNEHLTEQLKQESMKRRELSQGVTDFYREN